MVTPDTSELLWGVCAIVAAIIVSCWDEIKKRFWF